MAATLDKYEKQIVLLLQKDGRMSNVEIAKAIGANEGTVRRKLRRLISEGIVKVAGVANPHALGFKAPAIICLKIELDRLEEAVKRLAELPSVRYVALTTGNCDVIIEGLWADNEQLSDFLLNQLCKVPGVKDIQTSLLLRIVKQSYDWGLPEKADEAKNPAS
ncbi:MAG TPA: Lrp/AsnC family transcriptional regulator [Firmicutes bacterium]|nr:Lrp/AsnC family transcriptional regulator [Bacillota bacterium]